MPSGPLPWKLDLPPFPPLAWDGAGSWEGDARLPSWSGDPVTVSVRSVDGDARAAPTPEQTAAFRWLMEHEEEAQAAVLAGVFHAYPQMRAAYGYTGDEARLMPPIERPEQLEDLIGSILVYVLTTARDGVAYVGYELGCTWDEEHGLGVMTHLGRVIEVGQADTSFNEWTAGQDRHAAG